MATIVEKMVQQIKTLTDEEQRQIRALLDIETPQPSEATVEQERRFAEHLLAQGILSHLPTGKRLYPDPEPIIVQGEPVSETIIRERR